MDSRYFDFYDPPTDVTLVDLDTNSVTMSVLHLNTLMHNKHLINYYY